MYVYSVAKLHRAGIQEGFLYKNGIFQYLDEMCSLTKAKIKKMYKTIWGLKIERKKAKPA